MIFITHNKERWIQIGNSNYKISNKGRIISCLNDRTILLKPTLKDGKYLVVCLRIKKRKLLFKVHILVARHFVPNPENKPEVNHLDGNKINNNDWNLEWSTRLENMKHAFSNGLINNSKELNGMSKLSQEDIFGIRLMLKNGFKQHEIAKKYSTTQSNVSQIKNSKRWQ